MRVSFASAALLSANLVVPVMIGFAALPAAGQVSVDLHALDKLPQSAPATGQTDEPAPPAAGTRHGTSRGRSHEHAGSEHGGNERHGHGEARKATAPAARADSHAKPAAAATAGPPPPPATLPTAAPPPVVLAPDPKPPAAAAAPPALPPAPDGGSETSWLPDGMRVTFLPGRAELSAETTDAVRHLAGMVPHSDNFSLDVRAYAAAVPDDPSAARRLALSRSLAIRAALMSEGIPSTRIFLRALGANAGTGPADRCDIMVARLGAEPPVPHPAAPPAAAMPGGGRDTAADTPRPPAGAAPIARP